MLKQFAAAVAALVLGAFFAGCSSFQTATNLNDVKLTTEPGKTSIAHVHGEVWGVYLLGVIPFFTGSTITPGSCAMFENNVTVPRAVGMVTKTTQSRLNAPYLTDLQSEKTSVWLFPTVLFWYKSIAVSGNALR